MVAYSGNLSIGWGEEGLELEFEPPSLLKDENSALCSPGEGDRNGERAELRREEVVGNKGRDANLPSLVKGLIIDVGNKIRVILKKSACLGVPQASEDVRTRITRACVASTARTEILPV